MSRAVKIMMTVYCREFCLLYPDSHCSYWLIEIVVGPSQVSLTGWASGDQKGSQLKTLPKKAGFISKILGLAYVEDLMTDWASGDQKKSQQKSL